VFEILVDVHDVVNDEDEMLVIVLMDVDESMLEVAMCDDVELFIGIVVFVVAFIDVDTKVENEAFCKVEFVKNDVVFAETFIEVDEIVEFRNAAVDTMLDEVFVLACVLVCTELL